MQTYRFNSLTFLTSLTCPTQSLISCDDVYKWSRTTSSKPGDDYAWENTVYPEDTQPLLPSEASHTAALNAKNPFLKSTTVNSLAFVNAQADVSIKLETVGGAESDPGLYAIHVSGLTSRKDATRFSVTCHNFGGFRQPRDVCSEAQWGTTFANCEAQFSERPMCKSVAGLPGFKRYTVPYHDDGGAKRYKYEPGAANVDAMTAFLMARVKWYPDDAAKMFQGPWDLKLIWYKHAVVEGRGIVYGERHPTPTSDYRERMWGTYDSGAGGGCKCRNPWAADFNPSDPGERVWLHKDYDVILGELETPGKPFCLTTLHWNENWVSEVRSKWTLSPSPLLSLHLQMDLLPEPCYLS